MLKNIIKERRRRSPGRQEGPSSSFPLASRWFNIPRSLSLFFFFSFLPFLFLPLYLLCLLFSKPKRGGTPLSSGGIPILVSLTDGYYIYFFLFSFFFSTRRRTSPQVCAYTSLTAFHCSSEQGQQSSTTTHLLLTCVHRERPLVRSSGSFATKREGEELSSRRRFTDHSFNVH